MKLIRRIGWIVAVVVLVLAVVGVLSITGALPFSLPLRLDLSISRTDRTTWSEHVFVRARDVYRFHTLEVVQKLVFPHDFYDPDTDWDALLERRGNPYSYLTTEDRRHLQVYDLAREVGLDPRREKAQFLVLTVRAKIGFDLTDTAYAGESEDTEELRQQWIRVEQTDEGRTAFVRLPPPAIQELVIEDHGSATYPYPDVPLPPKQWRRVSEFVSERARQLIHEDSLDQAASRAEEFITSVLRSAGIDQVRVQ